MTIQSVQVGALRTNCYVIKDGNSCFVVDPGDEVSEITKLVGNRKLKFILLTHGHFDHLLALEKLIANQPNTKIYLGKKELEMIQNLSNQSHYLGKEIKDINLPIITVQEGNKINFCHQNIRVLETPGHTSGSVCYLVKNNLFSGDTLFYKTIGRTDLPTSDPIVMVDSLRKIALLPNETRVFPGHGRHTTIGAEKEAGYLVRFV